VKTACHKFLWCFWSLYLHHSPSLYTPVEVIAQQRKLKEKGSKRHDSGPTYTSNTDLTLTCKFGAGQFTRCDVNPDRITPCPVYSTHFLHSRQQPELQYQLLFLPRDALSTGVHCAVCLSVGFTPAL